MTTVANLREQLARRGIQPATLQLEEAAAYVGMSKHTFLKWPSTTRGVLNKKNWL